MRQSRSVPLICCVRASSIATGALRGLIFIASNLLSLLVENAPLFHPRPSARPCHRELKRVQAAGDLHDLRYLSVRVRPSISDHPACRVTPRSVVQPRVHCFSGAGHAIAGKLTRHATPVGRGDRVRKSVMRIDKQRQRIWMSTMICVVFGRSKSL